MLYCLGEEGEPVIRQQWEPSAVLPKVYRSVALGVFDGMHLGHRAVISTARNVTSPSQSVPLPTVTVFSLVNVPKSGGRLITETQEAFQAETLGVDEWLCVPFETVRHMMPNEFVQTVLHEALHAKVVCCGYNFRFGKDGSGDADSLKRLCEPLGMEVRVVSEVERNGDTVSSTAIRQALADGDVVRARELLGRPYTLEFPVQCGARRGTSWGIPTVNQPFPAGYTVPRFGVYASLVTIDGVQHRAITNIGIHPTVEAVSVPQAETYIEEYDGDLYGHTVAVELVGFIRGEQRFDTVARLREQIALDIRTADELIGGCRGDKAILFDFDDTLQDRVLAFSGVAREMLHRAFPALSEADVERRAQEMLKENNHGYVNYRNYFDVLCKRWQWPSDAMHLWWEYQRRFPFHSVLLADTIAVLRELKRRGYRLGVITNGEMPQQNLKLDFAGLRPLIDVTLVAGEEGIGKPDAEIFRRAAQRLCVAPENCVYVGDYPTNDIVGAQAAGMIPLYIDVHGRGLCPEGVEEIRSLSELLDRF